MKHSNKKLTRSFLAITASALMGTSAFAGGLDRTTYSPNVLFENGIYIEGSYANVSPDVTGVAGPFGISNINPDYGLYSGAFKFDLTDALSLAISTYEPVGLDLAYPTVAPVIPNPVTATIESHALAVVAKYDFNENFSVYGGIKYVNIKGSVGNLPNPGLGPALIHARFGSDSDIGYIAGVAYSKPEIALRVSLTYESATEVSLPTYLGAAPGGPYSSMSSGNTIGGTAEAWELAFQTGIAPGTLLFGSIRHSLWSESDVYLLGGANLSGFSDVTTYNIGLGRQINEMISASISATYEAGNGTPSDLNPTDGKFSLGGGLKFKMSEYMSLSTGLSYTWLGDNSTTTGARFANNNALALGSKISFNF